MARPRKPDGAKLVPVSFGLLPWQMDAIRKIAAGRPLAVVLRGILDPDYIEPAPDPKHVQQRRFYSVRRARMKAQFKEPVDRRVVYERGAGVCGICRNPVAADAFAVDHIIPIAAGGEHSYANTQPAHPRCNSKKGDKVGYVH